MESANELDEEPTEVSDINGKIAEEAKSRFRDGVKLLSDWRKEARESYDFVSGRHWDEGDMSKMDEDGRPYVTFNRVEPIIDAVAGMEITNRQEVRYIPRSLGDAKVNEILTEASKWVRDTCDAEDEESEAFVDALIGGIGWTETRMDYSEDAEGMIRIERVDPLRMVYDPTARKQNLSDAKWLMYIRDVDKDEFDSMYPGHKDIRGKGPWDYEDFDQERSSVHDAEEARFYRENATDNQADANMVRLVQYQRRVRATYWTIKDPQSGKFLSIIEDRWKLLQPALLKAGIPVSQAVPRSGWKYEQTILAGSEVLKHGEGPCNHSFSFRAITAKRDRKDGTWYGMVRAMKDPSKWTNKLYSEILETIQSGSKGGVMVESTAVRNMRKFEDAWANPRAVVTLEDGAIGQGRIRERTPATYPQGMDRLMQISIESIPHVTGVSPEMLGLTDKVQAGIVEAQRKQAGLAILARIFNSLRRYRKEQGRVLVYFMRRYISDGRLIRVIGDDGAKYVPLTKDDETIAYDVVVDDAPNSPNMKERVWAILQETMPYLMKMGIPIPPEAFDYMPIPSTLSEKWKAMMKPKGEDPKVAELTQMVQQMEQIIKSKQIEKAAEAQARKELEQMSAHFNMLLAKFTEQAKTDREVMLAKMDRATELDRIEMENQQRERDRQSKENIAELQARVDKVVAELRASVDESVATMNANVRLAQINEKAATDKIRDMAKDQPPKKKKRKVRITRGKDGRAEGLEVEDDE